MLEFIIYTLAVYGISMLVTSYDGLYGVFLRLRNKYSDSALKCIVCTSLYVAILLSPVLFFGYGYYLAPFAAVGVVILLEAI